MDAAAHGRGGVVAGDAGGRDAGLRRLQRLVAVVGRGQPQQLADLLGAHAQPERHQALERLRERVDVHRLAPPDAPASARVAGVIARSDVEHGFWWSPSNRPIAGVLGTAHPVDWALGDPDARANLLNEANVATIVREGGYRLWDNRTLSSDARYAFLSVARTADLVMDSIQRAHLWAVDRNVGRTYLSNVAESVNAYIGELVAQGALAGGSCVPSDTNTPETVASGRVCCARRARRPAHRRRRRGLARSGAVRQPVRGGAGDARGARPRRLPPAAGGVHGFFPGGRPGAAAVRRAA